MSVKRLAITIAGAVSLGSYEAGVLYEIVRALGQHNSKHKDDRIIIDVLTGASAGGMTAVIAAQKMLYQAKQLEDPYDNHFYRPWVADIDLTRMLKLEPGEPAGLSLFSSNAITEIADNYITKFKDGNAPTGTGESHLAVEDSLLLGLALSNLSGVGFYYTIQKQGGQQGRFEYTCFEDKMTGRVSAGMADGEAIARAWSLWRDAAIACGAFPFAFRVKTLPRKQQDFPAKHLDKAAWPSPPNFVYTDGGLFQNEPLGMAKNLVDEIDKHQDNDNRFFLFVAPGARAGAFNQIKAEDATFVATAKAIVGAVLNQAKFQDWVDAIEINSQIDLFRERAKELCDLLAKDHSLVPKLQPGLDALLPRFYSTPSEYQTAFNITVERLRSHFDSLSAAGKAVQKAFIDATLLLRTAAKLNDKDRMKIYGITATDDELLGHQLFAFRGFFDVAIRHHDYNVGRLKARDFLRGLKKGSVEDPELGPIDCSFPDDIFEYEDAIRHRKVPSPKFPTTQNPKQAIVDLVLSRCDQILQEGGIPWWLRPLSKMAIGWKIRSFLDQHLSDSSSVAASAEAKLKTKHSADYHQ